MFVIWHHGWLPRHLLWKQWKQFWGTDLFQKNGIGPKKLVWWHWAAPPCMSLLGKKDIQQRGNGCRNFVFPRNNFLNNNGTVAVVLQWRKNGCFKEFSRLASVNESKWQIQSQSCQWQWWCLSLWKLLLVPPRISVCSRCALGICCIPRTYF